MAEAVNREELELKLRAAIEEAKYELRLAKAEEKPRALRLLIDALHSFARLVLDGVTPKVEHASRDNDLPGQS